MQNLDVKQETKAQLISDKNKFETKSEQTVNKRQFVLTQNVLETDDTDTKGAKSVDHWEKETGVKAKKNSGKKSIELYFVLFCYPTPCFILPCCMHDVWFVVLP